MGCMRGDERLATFRYEHRRVGRLPLLQDAHKKFMDAQTPILAEGVFQGQRRKMVVLANRNGFYYSLTSESGPPKGGADYAVRRE